MGKTQKQEERRHWRTWIKNNTNTKPSDTKGKNSNNARGRGKRVLWNRKGFWERQAGDKTTQNGSILPDSISIRCINTQNQPLRAR